MKQHIRAVRETWVAPAFDTEGRRTERRYVAECSCGWYGTASAIRARACREWHRHADMFRSAA